jgi:hypothetical protein
MVPPSCVTGLLQLLRQEAASRSRKGVRTDDSLCWEKVRLRAKWATPRRGSDCGNLSGVVVSYTKVSEP